MTAGKFMEPGSTSTSNFNEALNFIDTALNKDLPVGLIVHYNPDDKVFNFHWVTIMEMKQNNEGDYMITVSTWGEEKTLNFNDVWEKSSYAGLVYFE